MRLLLLLSLVGCEKTVVVPADKSSGFDPNDTGDTAADDTSLPTGGEIQVSPLLLDVGATAVGASKSGDVSISNVGTGDLHVAISVSSGAPDYTISLDYVDLIPSASVAIHVTLKSATGGLHEGELTILANDDDEPATTVALTGIVTDGVDNDGDFYGENDDCNDADATIHPGADELCDGIDNDCDGSIDEDPTDASSWYTDDDGDGFGDNASAVSACTQPEGTTNLGGDCDDANVAIHPLADEHCDGVDEDCDGVIDNDPIDGVTYYVDADRDAYGNAAVSTTGCAQPDGYVLDNSDCDDGNAAAHPGASEVSYDHTDNDCSGRIDEMTVLGESDWTIRGTSASHATAAGLMLADDADGDGSDEVVVASAADDALGANAGAVAFHDLSNRGLDVAFSSGWALVGGGSGDAFGSSMMNLGDVDGDGLDEFVVGAPFDDIEDGDEGSVSIFDTDHDGTISGSQSVSSIRDGFLEGSREDGWFGWAMANGDFNASGETDGAFGAPGASEEAGRIYVYAGQDEWYADGGGGWNGSYLRGVSGDDHLGSAVLVDDLDGDGSDDLVGCAPDREGGRGVCWLVNGDDVFDADEDRITDWDSAEIKGANANDALGDGPNTIASGDMDGDGIADLAIGAPGYDGSTTGGGAVVLLAGGTIAGSITPTTASMLVTGDGALGTGLTLADADGDDQVDLLVGGTSASAGTLYVAAGLSLTGTLDLPGDESESWTGEAASDALGSAVAAARDVDGDALLDLVVAAPGNDGAAANAGKVYILRAW